MKIDQLSKQVVTKQTFQIGKMGRVTYSMKKNPNTQFTPYLLEAQAVTNKHSLATKFRAYSDKQNESKGTIKSLCKLINSLKFL